MKTLEFRLYPTEVQEQQLLAWLEFHRRLWNAALGLMQELDQFTYFDKEAKERAPCCPVPWSYRWRKVDPDDKNSPWERRICSDIRTHERAGLSCPLPQDYRKPRLSSFSYQALTSYFAKKNHPNWPALQACPSTLIRGTLKALATAWSESRGPEPNREPPRFKPRKEKKNPLKTLSDCDCKKSARVDGDWVTLPTLGVMRIRGNAKGRRWPSDRVVCTYRIMREASGWYLLLVGDVPSKALRETSLSVGLDAGVVHDLTTHTGRFIDGPAPLEHHLKRKERLNQRLARQQQGSANYLNTLAKLKRLDERIRRSRKLFAHKMSTYLLRTYGTLVLEDLKLENMVRRPKPKPSEDGQTFLPNNAEAKSVLNRRLLDRGLGQLLGMIEDKANTHNRHGSGGQRTVIRVDPRFTSQRCSACGHTEKGNRPNQKTFSCVNCGFSANADENAAKNILLAGLYRDTV